MLIPGFENISVVQIRGLTHTHVRITGDSLKHTKYNFIADVYIYRKTQEHSISRIDTKDEKTLKVIKSLLNFKFL
jgi:hypothetical protein